MIARRLALLAALAAVPAAAGCSSDATSEGVDGADELRGATSMIALLAKVPPGTPWAQVKPAIKQRLQANADAYYRKLRHDWGTRGLDEKEERLVDAPTQAMTENFDRVTKFLLSPEMPDSFVPSRDVTNPELLKQLKRLYLSYVARNRLVIVTDNPDFKDWDGGDMVDMLVPDAQTMAEQKDYAADVEAKLTAIPATTITDLEERVVAKATYYTRRFKNGFNNTSEMVGYVSLAATFYKPTPTSHVFKDDEAFLLAFNAVSFVDGVHTDVGTVDTFNWNLANYTDPDQLASNGLPDTSVAGKAFTTLAGWWKERVNAQPAATKKCTVYSRAERALLWDEFTANQLSNADGSETLEGYAASYTATATARVALIKTIANDAVEAAFPGTTTLTAAQKQQVLDAIATETRPAAVLTTIYTALDAATGNKTASDAMKAEFAALEKVGGYAPGETLRPADVATVNAMFSDVKTFLGKHYGGRTVDLVSFIGQPTITTGQGTFAAPPGVITIGLARATNKASLYSTLLHETKHLIDYKSKAPVQGAAWEGAALTVEQMVTPTFIEETMTAQAAKLPFYRLQMAIDMVRLTATTDATLKVLLRPSCSAPSAPNSIDFAKAVVKGYGYDDDATLLLRSRRAHWSTQYLSYDYGNVQYRGLVDWLQQQIGTTSVKVDPYLLQACDMPSPNKDAAAVTKLKGCLGLP